MSAAALLMVPAASLIPGVATEAEASTYVSGRVYSSHSRVSPSIVVGFSFGDPFRTGHVHDEPGFCSHGALYYYPASDVYAHYNPRYRYERYSTPFHHGLRHKIHRHVGRRLASHFDRRYVRVDTRHDEHRPRGHRHN